MAAALPYLPMAVGGIASLFGAGKGKETEYKPVNPQASEQQNKLMEYLMGRVGEQQPYAKVNPMSMDAMNMVSQFYTGNPYMQPGLGGQQPQQGQPSPQQPPMGGGGMGGMGGGGNPMGFGGNPMGGGGAPRPFDDMHPRPMQ